MIIISRKNYEILHNSRNTQIFYFYSSLQMDATKFHCVVEKAIITNSKIFNSPDIIIILLWSITSCITLNLSGSFLDLPDRLTP